MAEAATLPSLAEAMSWVGAAVSEIGGAAIGTVKALSLIHI